jgi:hypothetical protein
LISEETDLLEPTLLDELICHIGTLASVYHKPPNAFVEGRHALKKNLPLRSGVDGAAGDDDDAGGHDIMPTNHPTQPQSVVFGGNVGSLIDDFDILGPMPGSSHTNNTLADVAPARAASAVPNLLDDELSSILGTDCNIGGAQTPQPHSTFMNTTSSLPTNQPMKSANLLDDLFGDLNLTGTSSGLAFNSNTTFALPKEVSSTASLTSNAISSQSLTHLAILAELRSYVSHIITIELRSYSLIVDAHEHMDKLMNQRQSNLFA